MDLNKFSKLKNFIQELGRVAICYSGGIDSFLLLHICTEILGFNNTIGIFCNSDFVIEKDKEDAINAYKKYNIKILDVDLYTKNITANDSMRCAHCKKNILQSIIKTAKELGFTTIIDGSNYSDLLDYRPGLKVSNDLNIIHPFIACKINKIDILEISDYYKLKGNKKSSNACYATRIGLGMPITPQIIAKVKECEKIVAQFGFKGFRVRVNEDILRLELAPNDLNSVKPGVLNKIYEALKDKFKYITLDLGGYKWSGIN